LTGRRGGVIIEQTFYLPKEGPTALPAVQYEEIECRSAINRVEGMTFRWSLNPYQGCVHGCHYCYARRYHSFRGLDTGRDFSGIVFVKTNVERVLRAELSRPSWHRDIVSIGTATDPYQPIEGRYCLTRACLKAFADHSSPVSLVTKGTLALRDRDILSSLSAGPGCMVCFSITTLDSDLARRLEPGTPPPLQRLSVLRRLVEAGVHAGVFLAPIIPGLTDGPNNLETVVHAAGDHGARFLGAQVLYLKPGTREHFLGFLESDHPDLLAEYRRLYPGPYAPKRFQDNLKGMVREIKQDMSFEDYERPGKVLKQMPLGL
jgi:DNA repair photolyase